MYYCIIYKFLSKRVGMVNLTVSEKNDLIEVYDCLLARNSFKSICEKFLGLVKNLGFLSRYK